MLPRFEGIGCRPGPVGVLPSGLHLHLYAFMPPDVVADLEAVHLRVPNAPSVGQEPGCWLWRAKVTQVGLEGSFCCIQQAGWAHQQISRQADWSVSPNLRSTFSERGDMLPIGVPVGRFWSTDIGPQQRRN